MTATRSGAKRRIVIRRKNTSPPWSPPKLPDRPRVDIGPKSYGTTKSGRFIVIRFYVGKGSKYAKVRPVTNWFVFDFETGGIAKGSSQTGYQDKAKAIAIARQYRDEYGMWAKSVF